MTVVRKTKRKKEISLLWKSTLHISGEKEHQSHYRNEEYGISCGIFTPKIDEFEFGKPERYFKVDGNKRTFRSLDAAMRVAKEPKRMAQRKWKSGVPTPTDTPSEKTNT